MPIQYTREEIERELAEAVPYGCRREIARIAHMSESIVYGFFNPDDERASPAFKQLCIQAAMDDTDPDIGDDYFNRFCALREASRRRRPLRSLSPDRELGRTSKEFADIIVARCDGKPVRDQLREIEEARTQLDRLRDAIIADGDGVNHVN